jgi:hypothetical protein
MKRDDEAVKFYGELKAMNLIRQNHRKSPMKIHAARKIITGIDENAKLYGKVQEGFFIGGFVIARSLKHLDQLLDDDGWKFGGMFIDINKFLDSVTVADKTLRLATEQHKRLAKRIEEHHPESSNRKIAKALGVSEKTIRNDTADNSAPNGKKDKKNKAEKSGAAEKSAPKVSGEGAAKLVQRREERLERDAEAALRINTLPHWAVGPACPT